MRHNSKKGFTLVEIMIVVVIIGLLAAMAIPAFNKVRDASRAKTIQNNLRIIASAAQQYMLEEGKTQAKYADIVGPTLHVTNVNKVNSEDYTGIVIEGGTDSVKATTAISVTDGNGVKHTYNF